MRDIKRIKYCNFTKVLYIYIVFQYEKSHNINTTVTHHTVI